MDPGRTATRPRADVIYVSRQNERGDVKSSRKISARTFETRSRGLRVPASMMLGGARKLDCFKQSSLNSGGFLFRFVLVSWLECYKATHESATPVADVARRFSSPDQWLRVLFAPWIRRACWHVDQFNGHRLDNQSRRHVRRRS